MFLRFVPLFLWENALACSRLLSRARYCVAPLDCFFALYVAASGVAGSHWSREGRTTNRGARACATMPAAHLQSVFWTRPQAWCSGPPVRLSAGVRGAVGGKRCRQTGPFMVRGFEIDGCREVDTRRKVEKYLLLCRRCLWHPPVTCCTGAGPFQVSRSLRSELHNHADSFLIKGWKCRGHAFLCEGDRNPGSEVSTCFHIGLACFTA